MPSSEITYTTRNNEAFTGYYTYPDGDGPFPGILLITAIFGTDDEMKELADAWAADGFVVSVPDIFWRVLPGPTADREVAFDRYGKFDVEQGMLDIEDLIHDLKARPECNGKVGILGFCFGGRYAHLAAARLGVDAAGAYHGTKIGEHLDETPNVTCPVSFHFGEMDPAVPMEVHSLPRRLTCTPSSICSPGYRITVSAASMPDRICAWRPLSRPISTGVNRARSDSTRNTAHWLPLRNSAATGA
jgi:carboxymethylenebutenolidase